MRRYDTNWPSAVPWNTKLLVDVPGVYVVAETPIKVLYIGKAKNLAKRLSQFYRHKYGAKAPHRGGRPAAERALLLPRAHQPPARRAYH